MLDTSTSGVGQLRLAGFSTAASVLLPSVAAVVMRVFPRSTVRITEADPEVCFEMLVADRVDLAVVVATDVLPSIDDPRFEQQLLMEDSLDLLVPVGHRLAGRLDSPSPRSPVSPGSWTGPVARTTTWSARPAPLRLHPAPGARGHRVGHRGRPGRGRVRGGLVPRMARLPADAELVRVPLRGAATPVRHVRTSVRRGTAGQPEIALALAELRRVAAAVDRGDPTAG